MKYYKNFTIFGIQARINILLEFRGLLEDYFNNVQAGMTLRDLDENDTAVHARSKINYILEKAHKAIKTSGVSTVVCYSPPPAVGGLAGDIDIIYNLFSLRSYEMQPRDIVDFVDRALGIYENDKINAFIRTINPFFWLNRLFSYISRIPFLVLGGVGFKQEKLENSFLGRVVKRVLYLIEVAASFLVILQVFGYLDEFKTLIGI